MTKVNMTEEEYENALKQTKDQVSFNEKSKDDEKKEIIDETKDMSIEDRIKVLKEPDNQTKKETVVGRKGCVNEGQAEPKQFTNNELMTKLEEIVKLNTKFLERLGSIWKHKRWLEHEMLEKKREEKSQTEELPYQKEIEDKIKEIGNLFSDIVLLKMSEKE